MKTGGRALTMLLLGNAPLVLFAALFCLFGLLSPRFFSPVNIENILASASYIGIVAVGMTFVLLTGGIDLSVGSVMYLSGIAAGMVIRDAHLPPAAGFATCLCVGLLVGAFNALVIVKLRIVPFVATLAMMIACRGLGLLLTRSVAVNFPESITLMGTTRALGFIPLPVLIFALVVATAYIVLEWTPLGRWIYAVGSDVEGARKAGIDTELVLGSSYVFCGVFAALGGFVSIAQLGIVNSGFGRGDEFDAIAAAVLGGTSLFGGIGGVFPGTVLGAVLIQMVQAGLVFARVDLYIQPMVMAAIIFLAVFLDSVRTGRIRAMRRRTIMKAE